MSLTDLVSVEVCYDFKGVQVVRWPWRRWMNCRNQLMDGKGRTLAKVAVNTSSVRKS